MEVNISAAVRLVLLKFVALLCVEAGQPLFNVLNYVNIFLSLYSLPNTVRVVKSRRMRWAGLVARMGEGRGVHRVLVGKPEGKRPLGRPRRR